MDSVCGYCYDQIEEDDFLECEECEQYIHVRCLRRPGTPGDFHGDVFFKFTCTACTPNFKEIFEREKLPWTMIMILTVYNLSKQSQGLSRRGYFHWRSHIAHFIDKNWSFLMDPGTKRRKNWIGTVSGVLSHHSPSLFASGYEIFSESGWWKLTHNLKPKQYYDLVKTSRKERPLNDEQSAASNVPGPSKLILGKRKRQSISNDANDAAEVVSCRRTMPFVGKKPWKTTEVKQEAEIDILNFFESTDDNAFLDDMPQLTNLLDDDLFSMIPLDSDVLNDELMTNSLFQCDKKPEQIDNSEKELAEAYKPRIIQVNNYQCSDDGKVAETTYEKTESLHVPNVVVKEEKIEEELPYEVKYACSKSLFAKKSTANNKYPWELDDRESHQNNDDFIDSKNIDAMSEYEENEIFKRLKSVFESSQRQNLDIPPWIRRHFRKLCVRRMQRGVGIPIFNIEKFSRKWQKAETHTTNVLDRFHHLIAASSNFSTANSKANGTFASRLVGSCKYELFVSPHTERVLHPFIYRNDTSCPPWVRLLCELQYEVNGVVPSRSSIDFCYVRPQHIPAVNALLQRLFWPGIDMSECLSYPDFSIVALYKKLVVGCAFLVPDVGHNEAYVSFMAVRPGWQRAGIATFMLYHLTQTCIGKDITLHVSADNPAICLYQKFGFKIQELILDFYDKYLPYDSTQSRHGFLLRLER